MAREHNFLLGRGEQLSVPVEVPRGGGAKGPPYLFDTAKIRIGGRLRTAAAEITKLPAEACPNDEAVAVVTMHPRYISKSDFPLALLTDVGLRTVGSRSRSIVPEEWGIEKHPESAVTEELFVAGKRESITRWARELPSWTPASPQAIQLCQIEDVRHQSAQEKLKGIPEDVSRATLEVVIHDGGSTVIYNSFVKFATDLGAELLHNRRRQLHGLLFIPVRIDSGNIGKLAEFAFIRVARGMPTLRPLDSGPIRSARGPRLDLPTSAAADAQARAVIFDGGIPASMRDAISPWATLHEPPGIGPALPLFEQHGLAVTGAFLFGHIEPGVPLPTPICNAVHVRVLDGNSTDVMVLDVLDRITEHLDANDGQYDLVNISLGPRMAMDDDEITQWTAALDDRLAHGKVIATVAAGNDGELDASAKLNRVQPPADGVNVLSVGASASRFSAERAPYSCVGPGRSPGIVKPDGLCFGGSDGEEFGYLSPESTLEKWLGTSLAAPAVLRAAAGITVQVGHGGVGQPANDGELGPLAIRALLIHQADSGALEQAEVGWGLFETHPNRLITCDDHESMVVFQGELPVGQHLRLPIPLSEEPLEGAVYIKATLVISPQVDAAHPGNYTVAGVGATFRPHCEKYRFTMKNGQQVRSAHPVSAAFFSQSNLYSAPEYELRVDGHKWEPCLRATRRFQPASLHKPCFDLWYNHRDGVTPAENPKPIPYAVVITTTVRRITDYYNRVLRAYQNVLIPVRPRVDIQLPAS